MGMSKNFLTIRLLIVIAVPFVLFQNCSSGVVSSAIPGLNVSKSSSTSIIPVPLVGGTEIWSNYFGGDNGGPVSGHSAATPLPGVNSFRIAGPAFTGTNIDDSSPAWQATKAGVLGELSKDHDVIYLLRSFGMQFSGTIQFLTLTDPNACQADQNKCASILALQKWVTQQVREILALRPNALAHVYFELGNEINSACASLAVEDYLNHKNDQPVGPNCKGYGRSDPNIIPLYAESVLAPEVAAILKFNPAANIVMPSAMATYDTNVMDWVSHFLEYQVQGYLVQDGLQHLVDGKAIGDLVSVLNHHYTVTGPMKNLKEAGPWETDMDSYWSIVQSHHMKGLWATEELGLLRGSPQGTGPGQKPRGGQGASSVVRLISQYLYFANKNNLNSDQLRAYFWGWNLEPEKSQTSGFFGFQQSVKILGADHIKNVEIKQTSLDPDLSEAHAFQGRDSGKIFLYVFPKNIWSGLTLNQWTVSLEAVDLQKFSPHAVVHLFTNKGYIESSMLVDLSTLSFQLPAPIELGSAAESNHQDVMLIELDPLTPAL